MDNDNLKGLVFADKDWYLNDYQVDPL